MALPAPRANTLSRPSEFWATSGSPVMTPDSACLTTQIIPGEPVTAAWIVLRNGVNGIIGPAHDGGQPTVVSRGQGNLARQIAAERPPPAPLTARKLPVVPQRVVGPADEHLQ